MMASPEQVTRRSRHETRRAVAADLRRHRRLRRSTRIDQRLLGHTHAAVLKPRAALTQPRRFVLCLVHIRHLVPFATDGPESRARHAPEALVIVLHHRERWLTTELCTSAVDVKLADVWKPLALSRVVGRQHLPKAASECVRSSRPPPLAPWLAAFRPSALSAISGSADRRCANRDVYAAIAPKNECW